MSDSTLVHYYRTTYDQSMPSYFRRGRALKAQLAKIVASFCKTVEQLRTSILTRYGFDPTPALSSQLPIFATESDILSLIGS
jgi:hypothetical protein